MAWTGDLGRVREVLETDRVWAAFALADLAPEHRGHCEWHVAEGIPALILVYRGFDPPLFFAMGSAESVMPLIGEIAGEPELYISVRAGLLDRLAAAGYRLHDEKTLFRMVLCGDGQVPPVRRAEPLGPADYESLVRLFEDGDATGERPAFFQQSSPRNGTYFGIREAGELVAAAGTHVFSLEQSVACLGNVYTRRDRRGRGLAFESTAAVIGELLRQGVTTIALNVLNENAAAIRIYERLGFERYCEYREARLGA
jgi:ribosomal protein S18 acetylase RimI-like enzyme